MRASFTTKPEPDKSKGGTSSKQDSAQRPGPVAPEHNPERGAPAGLPRYLGGSGNSAPPIQPKAAPQATLPLFLRNSVSGVPPVQPKLVIGQTGDTLEKEADRIADAAVHPAGSPRDEAHIVQSKASTAQRPLPARSDIAPPAPGAPLATNVRARVEPLLGMDLGHVRVHTAPQERALARELGARAFTHQHHIWLGPGQSADDVALMAHESAHVVQQTAGSSPEDTIQRAAEAAADDGEQVRRRMQRRIDEALGAQSSGSRIESTAEQTPTVQSTPQGPVHAAVPSPRAEEEPRATEALRSVNRAAVESQRSELQSQARPDVDHAAEQQQKAEQAARDTAKAVERPPEPVAGPASQGRAAAEARETSGEGQGAAAAAEQAASLAELAFAAAENQALPEEPMALSPPKPVAPVDAGGEPLPDDPAAEARVYALAEEAQRMREQGATLRAHAAEERTNAQLLSGNVQLVDTAIGRSEGNVGVAQRHLTTRRQLLGQAQQALSVSEQKAANVADQAPAGASKAGEERERSGQMAGEARDLVAQNSNNTPDDPEAAQNAQEQGARLSSVSSDAATIDRTLSDVHAAAGTLVEDAARATEVNTQTRAKVQATEEALSQSDATLAQMQEQNASARGSLDRMHEGPATLSTGADTLDAQGLSLIQASLDMEARLHAAQHSYALGMQRVPAAEVLPPLEAEVAAAPPPAELSEASPDENVLVQRQADPSAPDPSTAPAPIDIGAGLPSWLTGQPEPDERLRQEAAEQEQQRRQRDLDQIETEARAAGGFENLGSGDRAWLALRLTGRNLFGGLSNISWPGLGGTGRGAGHLALALIDPRTALTGVIGGINTIANGVVTFARQPSWGGALTLAANIATGITVILGSITALAGVIAALMTAITIATLGVAAPITGPIIAFCATVMATVGAWTFWAGLIAAGLNVLVFLKDLYMAATAQTADQLLQHSDAMTNDGRAVGSSLLQAGMGRLAQVGGRHMQAAISRAGGGVRFAASMGARATPARVVRSIGRAGGVRTYARGAASRLVGGVRTQAAAAGGYGALAWQTVGRWGTGLRGFGRGVQTQAAAAGGYGALARQTVGRWGTGFRDFGRGAARELRSGGPLAVSTRQGVSRDFLLGPAIPRGSGIRGVGTTWREMVSAARTSRNVVAIEEGLTLAGRPDLNRALHDAEWLSWQNRIEGFEDWAKHAVTESPQGMVGLTSELLEARRLHGDILTDPTRFLRIGQDRATRGKSFDMSVEQRTGPGATTVERLVEARANITDVVGSQSFHNGIAHGASKIGPLPPPGTSLQAGVSREATVVVLNWPPPSGPVGGGAVQTIAADGTITLVISGNVRPRGNIFDNLLNDLTRNSMKNPAVNYLDAVNIIDREGNLLARFTNTGNPPAGVANWTR